ncbi:hypothetical protein L226DRAFT_61615 [Lentinus tigrinus ALCF2SS1-7]|uniref:uncharacterized protein n=1 Tax=Lentinus tigrinus ALCF2SS1-7 TaxID=1328758 RepID=UPI0011661C54|nr:hypothetical protein L226DRAFT_61615 [Lentinus tigrinus ALCF2SS1-7]
MLIFACTGRCGNAACDHKSPETGSVTARGRRGRGQLSSESALALSYIADRDQLASPNPPVLPLTPCTLPELKTLNPILDIEARDPIEDTVSSLLTRSGNRPLTRLSLSYGSNTCKSARCREENAHVARLETVASSLRGCARVAQVARKQQTAVNETSKMQEMRHDEMAVREQESSTACSASAAMSARSSEAFR